MAKLPYNLKCKLPHGCGSETIQKLSSPHLDYGDVIYMCATKDKPRKLQLTQNVACCIILRVSKDKYVQHMHAELGLLPLDTRRDMHLCFLCHHSKYHEGQASLGQFFVPVCRGGRRETRYGDSVKGRCDITYRRPYHWNHLPNECKRAKKCNEFKTCISQSMSGTFDERHL